MEHYVKQIVYYADGHSSNYPSGITQAQLTSSVAGTLGLSDILIERIGLLLEGPALNVGIKSLTFTTGIKTLRANEIYEFDYRQYPVVTDMYIYTGTTSGNDYIDLSGGRIIIDIVYRKM